MKNWFQIQLVVKTTHLYRYTEGTLRALCAALDVVGLQLASARSQLLNLSIIK
jgi:hypothetical protein